MLSSASTSALIHITELEFAFQIKTKVSLIRRVGADIGNKIMLERYIYIGNVRSLMKII